VKVSVLDANNNVVTSSVASVALAIGTNPGGGTLTGGGAVASVAGVATFARLWINKTGTGYTLVATSGALTLATSTAFNVTPGAATKLAYVQQPTNVVAGTNIAPSVKASVLDANNNVVTSSVASVALAIGTNPGGGTLTGGGAVNAVGGVATFAGLSIDKKGTGYTLAASSSGLTGSTSSAFNVTPSALSLTNSLISASTPITASAGGTTSTITVTARDQYGNPISGVTVVLASSGNGTTLTQPAGTTNASGVATGTLASTKAETKSISATLNASALTPTASVVVQAAAPAGLAFFGQPPSTVTAGASFGAVVAVQDAYGNLTGSTALVSLAFGTNAGSGTLTGGAAVNAVAGVATFSGLSIDKAGTGYTLTASSSGLPNSSASNSFTVVAGAAAKLAFTIQPPGVVTAGAGFGTTVTVQDANGNMITASTASLVLTSSPGGLAGTTTVSAVAGQAVFSVLTLTVGSYALSVTSSPLTGATSSSVVAVSAPNATITMGNGHDAGFATFNTSSAASVPSQVGATYVWSILNATGGGVLTGQGTNSITFNPGTTGPITLQCLVTNQAGTTALVPRAIAVVTLPVTPTITLVPSYVAQGSTGLSAQVIANPGMSYLWTITGGSIPGGVEGVMDGSVNKIVFNVTGAVSSSLVLSCVEENLAFTDSDPGVAAATIVWPCAALDQCHVIGVLSPSTGICTNPDADNGTPCNDGNSCTYSDQCSTGSCAGSTVTCPGNTICATYSCNGTSTCAVSYQGTATECRPAAGSCDVPEICSGTSASCPSDAFVDSGTSCRAGTSCISAAACTGLGPSCPAGTGAALSQGWIGAVPQ
jgi:hypothetical protein